MRNTILILIILFNIKSYSADRNKIYELNLSPDNFIVTTIQVCDRLNMNLQKGPGRLHVSSHLSFLFIPFPSPEIPIDIKSDFVIIPNNKCSIKFIYAKMDTIYSNNPLQTKLKIQFYSRFYPFNAYEKLFVNFLDQQSKIDGMPTFINKKKNIFIYNSYNILSPTIASYYLEHKNPLQYYSQSKYVFLLSELTSYSFLIYGAFSKKEKQIQIGMIIGIISRIIGIKRNPEVNDYNRLANTGYNLNLINF